MSRRAYPYISGCKKYKGHPNGLPFCPCGAKAVYRVEIQTNWFRGDDETEPRCEEHKDCADIEPCRKCLIERETNLTETKTIKCLAPATHIWTPFDGAETPLCAMHAERLSKLPSIAETIKPITP